MYILQEDFTRITEEKTLKKIRCCCYRIAQGYFRREDAEEIAQLSLMRIYENIGSYNKSMSSFLTWIHRITQHACIDKLRKEIRKNNLTESQNDMREIGGIEEIASPEAIGYKGYSPEERRELVANLREAVNHLNKPLREIILAIYFSGLTIKEIATQEEIPEGTVKSRLSAALKKLRSDKNLVEMVSS